MSPVNKRGSDEEQFCGALYGLYEDVKELYEFRWACGEFDKREETLPIGDVEEVHGWVFGESIAQIFKCDYNIFCKNVPKHEFCKEK